MQAMDNNIKKENSLQLIWSAYYVTEESDLFQNLFILYFM